MAFPAEAAQLLTVQEAAARLSLSSDYLYAAFRREELPCHRFGRAVRISLEDLDGWVAGRRLGSHGEARPE